MSKTDLAKLTKADLLKALKDVSSELKEQRMRNELLKQNADHPFMAVSVVKKGDVYGVAKIKFNEEMIQEFVPYTQGLHMADYNARKFLVQDIIDANFEITTEEV